jgi:hypothetical protein
MYLAKIFYFSIFFSIIMNTAYCQNRLDSLELKLENIKYIFINKNSAKGNVPPQSTYVHCMITCQERKELETITNIEWIALMSKNSKLGLIVTALLHDLFKETSVVFMHTESKDLKKWQKIYWKNEIKSWSDYLKNNQYK